MHFKENGALGSLFATVFIERNGVTEGRKRDTIYNNVCIKRKKGDRMEIERKFKVKQIPAKLQQYPCKRIEQAYLCTDPVVRVRRKGEQFWLTCKGKGFLCREEVEFPLTEEAYVHLLAKTDGRTIRKDRYHIPYGDYVIELDVFDEPHAPLVIAEVEFPSEEQARAFCPPDWFGEDVTEDPAYSNSNLSKV